MSHHRQHTLMYLTKASGYLVNANMAHAKWMLGYIPLPTSTAADITVERQRINTTVNYMNSIEHLFVQIGQLLEPGTSTDNLLAVRRILNRPHNDGSARAIPYYWKNALNNMNSFLNTHNTPDLVFFFREIAFAWQFTDHALWHLNDAILEEIYNEPTVQETPADPPADPPADMPPDMPCQTTESATV